MSKKALIITLCIMAVIALLFTGIFIYLHYEKERSMISNDTISKNDIDQVIKPDTTYTIKNLNDQYFINNISLEEVKYTEGKGFRRYTWQTEDEYPVLVKYFKISGLKDKQVEAKINDRIKEIAFGCIPSGEAEHKEVWLYSQGNFSNILSLSISSNIRMKRKPGDPDYDYSSDYNYNYFYSSRGITFDLNTGNEITLDDVFVDHYNYKTIIANELYQTLAYSYNDYEWIEETEEYVQVGRGGMEDEQFALMYQFDKGNYSFYVSPFNIEIMIHDPEMKYNDVMRSLYISLEPIQDKIAIFNRYLTDNSLFENGNGEEKKYYFINDYMLDRIHFVENNLFMFYNDDFYVIEEYKTKVQEWLNGRVNAERVYAQAHPDKQVFFYAYSNTSYEGEYPNNFDVDNINILRIEMPKKLYDESVWDEILNIIRHPYYDDETGEEYYWISENEMMSKKIINLFHTNYAENKDIDIITGTAKIYYQYQYSYGTSWNKINHDTFFILPSDERILSEEDLIGLDKETLNIAYNEIFARYGHDFTNKELRNYFMGQLWYARIPEKHVATEELNDIEKTNLVMISNKIKSL